MRFGAVKCPHCTHDLTRAEYDLAQFQRAFLLLLVAVIAGAFLYIARGSDRGSGATANESSQGASSAPKAPQIEGDASQPPRTLTVSSPCLSGGRHLAFERMVRAKLGDPEMFEQVSTSVQPPDKDNLQAILIYYRTTDPDGYEANGSALGAFDATTCKPEVYIAK